MSKNDPILTFVILPLMFVTVIYFGYRIADVVFFTSVYGDMKIVTDTGQEQDIQFTSCRLFMDSGNMPRLVVSDDAQNAMAIYPPGNIRLVPILQGKEISGYSCDIHQSSLELAQLRLGRSGSARIKSWKGSIDADCSSSKSQLHLSVDVHACK